jgi:hypothetical protein
VCFSGGGLGPTLQAASNLVLGVVRYNVVADGSVTLTPVKVQISDNVTTDETEPEVYVDGGIHAHEHISTEQAIALINWLVNDYSLDARRCEGFYEAIRSYWPGLPDRSLSPSYTGIRPKLYPAGGTATDFSIEGPEVHGVAGLVNLYGIESPGLTASLAIAEEVAARLPA